MAHGSETGRIRIGVSGCLVGEEVRYDGGHRRHSYVTEGLAPAFELVPECPEVGIGLGVPRPKIHLEAAATDGGAAGRGPERDTAVRLVGSDGKDLTAAMERYSAMAAARFGQRGVAGMVLKSRSPSCGIGDVKVIRDGAEVGRDGTGVFARGLAAAAPELPLIPDCGLAEPPLRDHWLTRVFALAEFSAIVQGKPAMGALFRFQARWKMVLMAHSETAARRIGRELARSRTPAAALPRYRERFFAGLAQPASRRTHRNVLEHLAGHLKDRLGPDDRRAIHADIRTFADGSAPLASPVRRIARWARRLRAASLSEQAYLAPRPASLRYREDPYPEEAEPLAVP